MASAGRVSRRPRTPRTVRTPATPRRDRGDGRAHLRLWPALERVPVPESGAEQVGGRVIYEEHISDEPVASANPNPDPHTNGDGPGGRDAPDPGPTTRPN